MKIKSKITGEICDLSELGRTFPRDVLAAPMDALGMKLKARMQGMAPAGDSGNLRASIANKTLIYGKGNAVVAIIGPKTRARGKPTKYAHLVEYGHRSGGATPKRIKHVAAYPFVRPTAALARSTAAQEIGAGARGLIDVVVKRMRKKKIRREKY